MTAVDTSSVPAPRRHLRLPALHPIRAIIANPAHLALLVVCVLHALSPLLLRGLHPGLGSDETVYISQIDPHVPAGLFSAPRARGLTLLTAPASLVSGSLVVLRIWLAVVSGVGLYLAFLPWLRLRRGAVVPLAAALWSGLWLSVYYGYEAMPNQYVAYGAIAGTGLLLRIVDGTERARPWVLPAMLGVDLALTALVRPTDALCLLVALCGATLVIRGLALRRRGWLLALMAGGWLAGTTEWIVEAFVRFGGPVARFHSASAENTGGLHWSLGDQMRVLAGPILCRPGCTASSPIAARVWWFAIVPFVALGLVAAWRQRHLRMHLLALVAALAVAAQYLIALDYAAPRFLEPSYLLLSLPVAEGIEWLVTSTAPSWRPILVTAGVVALATQGLEQTHILRQLNHSAQVRTERDRAVARALVQDGLRRPCTIRGKADAPIAFLAGCTDARPTHAELRRSDASFIVIGRSQPSHHAFWAGWPERALHGRHVRGRWREWVLRDPDGSDGSGTPSGDGQASRPNLSTREHVVVAPTGTGDTGTGGSTGLSGTGAPSTPSTPSTPAGAQA